MNVCLLRASDRSEHTCTFIDIFIHIYGVTKILHKLRANTFTENYGIMENYA